MPNGQRNCIDCGLIEEADNYSECYYESQSGRGYRHLKAIDREVVKFMERSDLGTQVKNFIDKNANGT